MLDCRRRADREGLEDVTVRLQTSVAIVQHGTVVMALLLSLDLAAKVALVHTMQLAGTGSTVLGC